MFRLYSGFTVPVKPVAKLISLHARKSAMSVERAPRCKNER
jgi:hypothetical protein